MTSESIRAEYTSVTAGIFKRLAQWIRFKPNDDAQTQEVPVVEIPRPGPLESRRESSRPILVPARGGALCFRLDIIYEWKSDGLDRDSHVSIVTDRTQRVDRDIRIRGCDAAARYSPHWIDEMQSAMNTWTDQKTWRFDGDDFTLSCGVRIRVLPDDVIRDRLVAHWQRIVDIDNDNELNKRRARMAMDLATYWSEVLTSLRKDPMAAHAARMTEEKLAAVVGDLAKGQAEAVQELVEIFERLAASDRADLRAFHEAFDSAIAKYVKGAIPD